MVRIAVALLGLAACRHVAESPVVRTVSTQPARVSRVRTDRAPVELGGGVTWATAANAVALKFCPGDRELVSIDDEATVRRYRVADGSQLAVAPMIGPPHAPTRWDRELDCGSDGSVVTIDRDGSPVLIDETGNITRPPTPIKATRARFGPDGAVWALTRDGVTSWSGVHVAPVLSSSADAAFTGLGDDGVYLERRYKSGQDLGTWMVRGGTRIQLPGGADDMDLISAAPDGAIGVISHGTTAYGWIANATTAGPRIVLLENHDTDLDGLAVTTTWIVTVDGDGTIHKARRPALRWQQIREPCGDERRFLAMAVAHDDQRIAVACRGVGIRLFDIATGKQLSTDAVGTGADAIAWSPSGDALATLSSAGPLRVWRDGKLVTTIADVRGRTLWWTSETELAGENTRGTWTFADGDDHASIHLRPDDAGFGWHAHSAGADVVAWNAVRTRRTGLTVLGDDTAIELPDTMFEWIAQVSIDARGNWVALSRGRHGGEPASEVVEVDLSTGRVESYAFPTTALAAGDHFVILAKPDGEIDIRDRSGVRTLGHHANITELALAGDVVAAGSTDGTISLWSTSGGALGTLTGNTAAIRALAFAPDGRHLASTTADSTRVWDLSP